MCTSVFLVRSLYCHLRFFLQEISHIVGNLSCLGVISYHEWCILLFGVPTCQMSSSLGRTMDDFRCNEITLLTIHVPIYRKIAPGYSSVSLYCKNVYGHHLSPLYRKTIRRHVLYLWYCTPALFIADLLVNTVLLFVCFKIASRKCPVLLFCKLKFGHCISLLSLQSHLWGVSFLLYCALAVSCFLILQDRMWALSFSF